MTITQEMDALGIPKRGWLPEDESAIVWSDLTFEDKLAKLQALRAAKKIRPQSFCKRITSADHIHAHALGVLLD